MARLTQAQRLAAGLVALGWVEGKATTHYRRFHHVATESHVFLGKAGALRVSRTGRVSSTAKVREEFRAKVLEAADQPKQG